MLNHRELQTIAFASLLSPADSHSQVETEHARRIEIEQQRAQETCAPLLERGVAHYMALLEVETARRLAQTLFDSPELGNRKDCPALNDEDYGQMVALAMDLLLEADHERVVPMFTLLLALRPDDPRPYVGLTTAVWQTDGAARAAEIYLQLTDKWPDPEIAYFGADCMWRAGWRDQAEMTVSRGIHELQSMANTCQADALLLDQLFSLQQEIADV
jgi:hypothetical protein